MNSRRDFLRTVILGTGTVFLGLPLGCKEDQSNSGSQPIDLKGKKKITPLSTGFQRHEEVHRIFREGEFPTLRSSAEYACDVVIVGAGPSGLSAARYLQKLGFSVIIVENEAHVGGAGYSSEWQGLKFPLGSVYFVTLEGTMQELCTDAEIRPVLLPEDGLYMQNKMYVDFWSDKTLSELPIPEKEKFAMKKFRDNILSMEIPEYPLPGKLSPHLASLDAMTGYDFVSKYNSPVLNKLMDLYALSAMGAGLNETNAYSFLNFYSSEFGEKFGTPRYTFAGGLNAFNSAVAEKIGKENFLLEHIAFRMENTAEGVEVHCLDKNNNTVNIKAKAAIAALPKYAAHHAIPELAPPQRTAMRSLSYAPYATVHLCSSEELVNDKAFDLWIMDQMPYFSDITNPRLMYSKGDAPDKAFVYSLYIPMQQTNRKLMLDEVKFAAFCRTAAERAMKSLNPSKMEAIEEIQGFAWGHGMVIPTPGSHNGPAQLASQTVGKIFFAQTDNDSTPAIENALAHGRRTAENIAATLHGRKGY